jgi:hypothetical protein
MNLESTTPLPRQTLTTWRVYGTVAVWLAAVAASWWWMSQYEFATNAALPHGVVDRWPAGSTLTRPGDHLTLLLFLHPKCACSRASLTELERMLASVDAAATPEFELIVVATVPIGADDQWLESDTVDRVRELAATRLFVDRGGVEAARFGASTSGLVMLFDEQGTRRYAGGITVSRAHEGDNVGRDAVEQILRGKGGQVSEIPPFGCRLCLPEPPQGIAANVLAVDGRREVHDLTDATRRL